MRLLFSSCGVSETGSFIWLSDQWYPQSDGIVIIRRLVRRSGRGSIFLQNQLGFKKIFPNYILILIFMASMTINLSFLWKITENCSTGLEAMRICQSPAAEFQKHRLFKKDFEQLAADERKVLREKEMLSMLLMRLKSFLKDGEEES